jgi:uncharacterized RDD family membrane protein YckC
MVDSVLFGLLTWVLGVFLSWAGVLVAFIAFLMYSAALEGSSYGATFGKHLLGLRVTDLDGRKLSLRRSTGRAVAKVVSTAVFPLGHVLATFTEGKSALHDLLAGTLVLRRP